jgi:oligopeptide transport system substrate-binding protein
MSPERPACHGFAIKLMSEAGYGPRKPLTVKVTYTTSENRKQIAIASMWKKLGVNVELVSVEQKVRVANQRLGDFEVGFNTWIGDLDAREFLFLWQTSTRDRNYARFSNPDYDRLMDAASVTGNESKRAQLLGQAEQVLLREMPVSPIYFDVAKNLVGTRVKGWEDNLLNITYVKNLSLEK